MSAEYAVLCLVVLSTVDNKGGEGKVCREKGLKLVPFESYSNINSNTNPVLPEIADPLFWSYRRARDCRSFLMPTFLNSGIRAPQQHLSCLIFAV